MHILIGSLTAADLFVGVVAIPFDIIGDSFPYIKKYKYICLTDYSIAGFTLFYSCACLLLIAIDRCISVLFSVKHLHFNKHKLRISIAIVLGHSFLVSFTPLCWNNYVGTSPLRCFTRVIWRETFRRMIQFIWNASFWFLCVCTQLYFALP